MSQKVPATAPAAIAPASDVHVTTFSAFDWDLGVAVALADNDILGTGVAGVGAAATAGTGTDFALNTISRTCLVPACTSNSRPASSWSAARTPSTCLPGGSERVSGKGVVPTCRPS